MINQITSEILFRCPCCQKLYCTEQSVFASADNQIPLDSHVIQIPFECDSCQTEFLLFNQREDSGLYAATKKVKYEFSKCPKCQSLKKSGEDECPSCGVLESKYQIIQKLENSRLYELNKTWSMALADFENDEVHQKFISQAQNQMALNYAHKSYMDLKSQVGEDPLVCKYIKQIELRLSQTLKLDNSNEKSLQKFGSQFSTPSTGFNIQHLFLAISIIGVIFFIVNVLKPQYPQVNGLLIAGSILSLGLWILAKGEKV